MDVELEQDSSVIETKTAIEWENERSEDEGSQTTTTTTASSDACQPILCFDAYGNLTSQKASIPDSGFSPHLDPFSSYLDLSSSYQLSSSEEDDGLDEAFSYSSAHIGSKKKCKPKTKIRFSDNQLKQVIKEEVQEVVTTSRYGRERKKRTSDGFLFGTINFNELRRVTASAITVPVAKRDRNDQCDLNRINFDCLSNSINELGPPGDAPPDKILASCESSSEAEDIDCKPSSTSEKTPKPRRKKTSRQKNIVSSENTVQSDGGVVELPSHKKTRKRKSIEDKSAWGVLPKSVFANDLTSHCLRSEVSSTSNDDNVPARTNKRAKLVDSAKESDYSAISLKKRSELSCEQLKENEVKAGDLQVTRKERASRRKRHSRITSDDEGEANFTPRKKKKKTSNMCLNLPELQDDLVDNSVLQSFCYESKTPERLNASSPLSLDGVTNADGCPEAKALRGPFDLGTVGDIADDLRLLKDLTEKSQCELLPSMSASTVEVEPEEVPQSVGICSVTSTSTPKKNKPPMAISRSKHKKKQMKKRGRPAKILCNKSSMKLSLHLRGRKPNFKKSSGHAKPSIKMEPDKQEYMVVEDEEEEEEERNTSVDYDSNSIVSKRGRRIKKPDLTDISFLHQKEVEARQQRKDAAAAATTAQQEYFKFAVNGDTEAIPQVETTTTAAGNGMDHCILSESLQDSKQEIWHLKPEFCGLGSYNAVKSGPKISFVTKLKKQLCLKSIGTCVDASTALTAQTRTIRQTAPSPLPLKGANFSSDSDFDYMVVSNRTGTEKTQRSTDKKSIKKKCSRYKPTSSDPSLPGRSTNIDCSDTKLADRKSSVKRINSKKQFLESQSSGLCIDSKPSNLKYFWSSTNASRSDAVQPRNSGQIKGSNYSVEEKESFSLSASCVTTEEVICKCCFEGDMFHSPPCIYAQSSSPSNMNSFYNLNYTAANSTAQTISPSTSSCLIKKLAHLSLLISSETVHNSSPLLPAAMSPHLFTNETSASTTNSCMPSGKVSGLSLSSSNALPNSTEIACLRNDVELSVLRWYQMTVLAELEDHVLDDGHRIAMMARTDSLAALPGNGSLEAERKKQDRLAVQVTGTSPSLSPTNIAHARSHPIKSRSPVITYEMLLQKARESHSIILGGTRDSFDETWWFNRLVQLIDLSGGLLKDQQAGYEAQNPPQHVEGDLVWVALRGYPVWPAVVVLHPVEQLATRIEVKHSSVARLYHLHFLNDSERQHWMRQDYVLPYEGRQAMKDGLLKTKEEFTSLPPPERNFQALLLKSLPPLLLDPTRHVAGSKLFKWNAAVNEADLSLLNTRGERIIKYSRRNNTKDEASSATAATASNVKKIKKKKKKNLDSVACLAEPVTLKQEPVEISPSVSRSQSPTLYMLTDPEVKTTDRARRSPSNDSEFSGFDDSSASEMNKKRKLEVIANLSKQDAFELFYKVRLAAFSKANPGCNDSRMKEMLHGKWVKLTYDERVKFCERHLDSQDESDDAGGKSGKGSHDDLDNQSEVSDVSAASSLQSKKNYKKEGLDTIRGTYRLPRNEKVCHKCESVSVEPNGADMIRCKGLCCGSFHLSCVGLQTKPENDKDFKCKECETGLHPCFICTSVSGVAEKSSKKEGKAKLIKREKYPAKDKGTEQKIDGKRESVSSDTESKSVALPDTKTENKCGGGDADVPETVDSSFNVKKSDEASETKICTMGSRRSSRLTSADISDEVESNSDKMKEEAVDETTDVKSGVINTKSDAPVNEDTKELKETESAALTGSGDGDMASAGAEKTRDASSCRQVQRCTVPYCGKFYHLECALKWPQVSHTWQEGKKLVCPRHMCHMCAASAEDMNCAMAKSGSMTRCLRCPTTYHTGGECIAAGSEEISSSFHVCSKHSSQAKSNHLNVTWCFGCSKGGSLVLCDECPAAFHLECLDAPPPAGGGFVCEDCINGKLPVYGDIVWAKLGSYRWWPGQVLHPRFIPDNIEKLKHTQGMFCVHFFGSNDYYWVHRGRVFNYQEGDRGCKTYQKNTLNRHFEKALEETKMAFEAEQTNKAIREAKRHEKGSSKPPPFVRIDTNRPVGSVKRQELELPPRCDCDLNGDAPCGPNTSCINRMLMIECAVDVCGAGDRCCNQRFQRRQYPNLAPAKVEGRGWGLRALQDIRAGDFVIEYVGELVDEAELWRRIDYMHHISEENYYFLTITKDIIIDAGPKGNLARFMNHSCDPNCETQKWQVGTETRVGLFALQDILAGSEVTFNYNFECVGTEKKKCHCGSELCSGYIGAKVPKAEPLKKGLLALGKKKRRKKKAPPVKATEDDCFRCGLPGDLLLCDVVCCPKGYHLNCLGLMNLPKGKWLCPWHHCDECGSRANSRCELCPNSFCRSHSTGKITYSATVRGAAATDAVGTQSVTGAQGGISYCSEHTELAVSDFLANTRATLRVQTDAVRAESQLPQAPSAVVAAPVAAETAAAAAALQPSSQRAAEPSRRISLERSWRAKSRSHIRELYNLSEQCNEDDSMDWSVLQALAQESGLLPAEDKQDEDDGVTIGLRARALSSGSSSSDDGRPNGATKVDDCHAKDSTLTQCSKNTKFVTITEGACLPAPAVINVVVRKRSKSYNAARDGNDGTRNRSEGRVEEAVNGGAPSVECWADKRNVEVQGKDSAPSECGRDDKDGDTGTGTEGSASENVSTDKVDPIKGSVDEDRGSLVMPPSGLDDGASESLESESPCKDEALAQNKGQPGRSEGKCHKNKMNGKRRDGPFGRKLKRNLKWRGSSSVSASNKIEQRKGAQKKKPDQIAPVSNDKFGQDKGELEKSNPDFTALVGSQLQKRDLTAPLSSVTRKNLRQSKMDDFIDVCLTSSLQKKNGVRSFRNPRNTPRNVASSGQRTPKNGESCSIQKSLESARSPLLRNSQRVINNNVQMPDHAKNKRVVGAGVGERAGDENVVGAGVDGRARDENSATGLEVVLGAVLPQGVSGSFVEGVPTGVNASLTEGREVTMNCYQQHQNRSNDGDEDDDIAVVFEQSAHVRRTTCKCCKKAFSPTGTMCRPGLAAIKEGCRPLATAVGGCRPHIPAGGGCRPRTPTVGGCRPCTPTVGGCKPHTLGRGRGHCGNLRGRGAESHYFSPGCGSSACKSGGACRSVQAGTGNSNSVNDGLAFKTPPSQPAGVPKKCCPVHSPAPRPLADHGNTCRGYLARASALNCCRGGATGCGRSVAGGPVARPCCAGHHGHQARHHYPRGVWPHRVQSLAYETGHRQAPMSLPDAAPQNGPIVKTGGLHVDMSSSHPRVRRTITSPSLPNEDGGQEANGDTSDDDDDILPLTVPTITIEV